MNFKRLRMIVVGTIILASVGLFAQDSALARPPFPVPIPVPIPLIFIPPPRVVVYAPLPPPRVISLGSSLFPKIDVCKFP